MRLTGFLTTTLAFASLALAAAVPNPANADLVDRSAAKPPAHAPAKPPASAPLVAGTGIFKNIKATKAAWQSVAAACGSGKKRGLESRAPPSGFIPVAQGKHEGYGSIPIGLYTEGLVTCFGIVVKGTAPASNAKANTRWLLHMQASEATGDWAAFEKDVAAAKLTGMTGYMSLPSPAAVGTKIGPLVWTKDDQDLTNKMITSTTAALKELIGHAPVVHMRPLSPASSMQISGQGEVKAGDTVL